MTLALMVRGLGWERWRISSEGIHFLLEMHLVLRVIKYGVGFRENNEGRLGQ